jgi:L-threonylcarbamoyladenylate synthase
MKVLSGGFQGISRCIAHLRSGGILAIPTETVYGLAAIATNPEAVSKVFAAKERPSFDPLIVHIPQGWGFLKKLDELGITDSSLLGPEAFGLAEKLMRRFWPGPLTLVLPRGAKIPDLVTSGLTTVGIRMPRHTLAQDLLKHLQEPLAAPSANRFGRISPTSSSAVMAELGERVPYVLEGGPCEVGLESTIVHLAPDGGATLLRPGGLSRERIEAELGKALLSPEPKAASTAELAPGMLASHYAPRKKLVLFFRGSIEAAELTPASAVASRGVMWLSPPPDSRMPGVVLSPSGSLEEMARLLFATLRSLDENPAYSEIWAEAPTSDQGLGAAIQDRLKRASAPKALEPRQR